MVNGSATCYRGQRPGRALVPSSTLPSPRAYGNAGVPVARTSVGVGGGVAKEGLRERTLSSGWREVMGGLLRDVTT